MSDLLKMSEMSKFKPEKCILEVCRRCYNNSNNIAYAAPCGCHLKRRKTI